MGLLQKLKSALGLDGTGSSESGRSGDVDVTVEREPSTESEDAVKGTETASSGGAAEEPADSETAASGSSEVGSDEPSAEEFEPLADETDESEPDETDESEPDETDESEPDEADEAPEPEEAATDAEAATPTERESDEQTAAAEPDAEAAAKAVEGSDDPVTELSGIGPAYGDRLAGVGIETVGELAAADAAEVADRIDLGESRVAGWVEQANDY